MEATAMVWPFRQPTERERWAAKQAVAPTAAHVGLGALDPISARLYGEALPRGVLVPRPVAERPRLNHFMRPEQLLGMRYQRGHVILGKLGLVPIGIRDDRPIITEAGARAGKTRTVLMPNLFLWPGSALVLDPKGELADETAEVRRALGHDVHVLDPFRQSGLPSAHYNLLDELNPAAESIVDDVATITQAIVPEEKDSRSKHWVDSARALLEGTILLTLILPKSERHLITVRQLLTLTHWLLLAAVGEAPPRHRKS
jgi:type IV secretion system protein VirD4